VDERRLKEIPLFETLSREELREVARHADEVDVREGKRLMSEGDFAYEFFVIEDGEAEVLSGDRHVADLGPGDFLGEMGALARGGRRNASVVARSPMSLVVMTARDFRQMTDHDPRLAERIRATVERRCDDLAAAVG
jgi:CRP-like cAMP-binding protein